MQRQPHNGHLTVRSLYAGGDESSILNLHGLWPGRTNAIP